MRHRQDPELPVTLRELVLSAGTDGISSKAISERLGVEWWTVKRALAELERVGYIERNMRGGSGLLWGAPGIRAAHVRRVKANRLAYKRKYNAQGPAKLPEDEPDLDVVRIIRPASEAPPLRVTGPASVWDLAR